MIDFIKCFEKKSLYLYGMVLIGSFTVLFVFSSQSQYYVAAQTTSPMMMGDELASTNQTKDHDMNNNDMDMMNMMMQMMNMMQMMMNMMNMSSSMSGGMDINMMNMSTPMTHSQSGSNMSMMTPQQ
jgi:hypothetical protein